MTKYFNVINNYKFDDTTILLRLFYPFFYCKGYYWNSQYVYRDFTIVLNQSESLTQPCHARILDKMYMCCFWILDEVYWLDMLENLCGLLRFELYLVFYRELVFFSSVE